MAHVEKYTRVAVGHLLEHYARESNASNENIDPTRTPTNYNLAPQRDKTDFEYIRSRLKQVKVQNRKDVNVLADWCVTLPKDLPQNEEAAFFKAAYEFLEGKYGKENVVSAWVHRDEVTPHLHFSFVPVVEATHKRTGERFEKVSAKELLTRSELQNFHPALQQHIEHVLGHTVSIINGATKEGNVAIQELKRQSAKERLANAERMAAEIINEANTQIAPLKAEYEAFKAYIEASREIGSSKYLMPPKSSIKTKGVFNKEQYVEVPLKEWEARHVSANQKTCIDRAQLALDNSLRKLEQTDYAVKLSNLQFLYDQLERSNRAKDEHIRSLENELKKAIYQKEAFFNRIPQEHRQTFIDLWEQKQERERGHHRFR